MEVENGKVNEDVENWQIMKMESRRRMNIENGKMDEDGRWEDEWRLKMEENEDGKCEEN